MRLRTIRTCTLQWLIALVAACAALGASLARAQDMGTDPVEEEAGTVSAVDPETYAAEEAPSEEGGLFTPFYAGYYGIFYGPGLQKLNSEYQPALDGKPDKANPVVVKNYATLGYSFDEDWSASGTAYFHARPSADRGFTMMDPYARLANEHVVTIEGFNWYSDLRLHLPVTKASREADLLSAIQSWNIVTYEIPDSRFYFGSYVSLRKNFYGGQGYGDDLQIYIGPYVNCQFAPNAAFSLLFEANGAKIHGDRFRIVNDGMDIQPGVTWDITQAINVNPYVNIPTTSGVSFKAASIGMTLSVELL